MAESAVAPVAPQPFQFDGVGVRLSEDLGGATSLLAAAQHPGKARALVLVDVVVSIEPAGVARIRDFMAPHPDGFASLEEVANAVAAFNPTRRRPRNLDGLRKNVRLHGDGRWHWHWDPAFMRIDDEPQRRIEPDRLRAAASRLTIPTLIVRGGRSDVVSAAGMADSAEAGAPRRSGRRPGRGPPGGGR